MVKRKEFKTDMNAVIMAGGEGIRLRPLTMNCSKPMLPVVNRPLIEHSINYLKKYGIRDISVSLFYQPGDIIDRLGDGSSEDVNLKYSVEINPLGTAGGVKQALQCAGKRTVVISGDTVTDIPLDELLDFHVSRGADFTAALVRCPGPEDYGVAVTDSSMRIVSFQEKPASGMAAADTINTGIYVIEPEIIEEFIPDFKRCDFSLDLIPALIEKKKKIYGFLSDRYWCDAGTISSYLGVHRDILDGRADVLLGGDLTDSPLRYISGGPVLLGEGSEVSRGANLAGYSVIGSNASVDRGAFVSESVIHDGSRIGQGAVISGSIIGRGCTIGNGAVIGGGAVIGEGSVIPADSVLPSGIKLPPSTYYNSKSAGRRRIQAVKSLHSYYFSEEGISRSEMNYKADMLNNYFISRLKRFYAQ